MAEHLFKNNDSLPMHFIVDTKLRQLSFVTEDLVMPDDTVSGNGFKGTIKEIIEERPSRANWERYGYKEPPTFFKVQLY